MQLGIQRIRNTQSTLKQWRLKARAEAIQDADKTLSTLDRRYIHMNKRDIGYDDDDDEDNDD